MKEHKIQKGDVITFSGNLFSYAGLINRYIYVENCRVEETTNEDKVLLENNKDTLSMQFLTDVAGLTKEESKKVFDNILNVGLHNITKLKPAIGTGVDNLQSFAATCDGLDIMLTIQKRSTYYIGYGSGELFDLQKGGVVGNIIDYLISNDDAYSCIDYAKKYVKSVLKSPSTAKFPGVILSADEWSVSKNKDSIQIISYVDSQNSFGATIRSNFVVNMDYKTKSCMRISIGGKVVYGK